MSAQARVVERSKVAIGGDGRRRTCCKNYLAERMVRCGERKEKKKKRREWMKEEREKKRKGKEINEKQIIILVVLKTDGDMLKISWPLATCWSFFYQII